MTAARTRSAHLSDATYFAGQLARALEELVDTEQDRHLFPVWQQAAALARRIRGVLRKQADRERQRRKKTQ